MKKAAIDIGYKLCNACKVTKDIKEFYHLGRRSGRELSSKCKPCANEYAALQNQKVRVDVLNHYSNGTLVCKVCGESRTGCLDLDHLDNDGAKARKDTKNSYTWFRRIKKAGYPAKFQVLCRNCNWLKHTGKLES